MGKSTQEVPKPTCNEYSHWGSQGGGTESLNKKKVSVLKIRI